ncbi:unnamed protein product, partial [Mesorhabditis spiculigera]
MVVEIIHPGRPSVSKDEIRDKIAHIYKTTKDLVIAYGFRCQYGGGRSAGFALVYDSMDFCKKFEPKHRLIRFGLATKKEKGGRKQRKEKKNRMKKVRGTKKAAAGTAAKK